MFAPGRGAGPLAGLTLQEIDDCVRLTPEQRAAMQQALDKAGAARKERAADWRARRHGRGPRPDRFVDRPGGELPPGILFLEEASRILTPDQFLALARRIAEKRDRWMESRPPRDGKEALLARRIADRIDGRLARLDGHLERRAAFLGRVLGLDPEQARLVRAAILETGPPRREILGDLKAGRLAPRDAASRIRDLEEKAATQVQSMLTPEQQERWMALRDLIPGDRFGWGPVR